MALKQVGARTEGDVYQGLFFWRQAAALLIPGSGVRQVILEHEDASGVDDVVVFYKEPGIDAGGWYATADFYQLKYHVDRRNAYSADAFMDPAFINSKSSLLQRFYQAYKQISISHRSFRLHLASNWRWRDDDMLAGGLREYDGALPEGFFTSSEGSQLGKIRENWRAHLAIDRDDFEVFGRKLRFQLDHFGRRDFRELVHYKLALAGLRTPDTSKSASLYESLFQQFLMNRTNSFDAASFRELCVHEGLLNEQHDATRSMPTIGIRSFMRFAERLEEETDEFVCVAEHFEGRSPRNITSWTQAAHKVVEFLSDPNRRAQLRAGEYAIMLECHGSLAILAGYELSRNSGCMSYPVQKPECVLWKPTHPIDTNTASAWASSEVTRDTHSPDIALTISATHDIAQDVERYLDASPNPSVHSILCMQPKTGIGIASVQGPDHALKLAADLVTVLHRARSTPTAVVHLFTSAPNSLLFFIGQFREALGRIVIYEYDFGFERHCSYEPSIALPYTNMKEAKEVRHGT